jgi:hypothetical protein
MNAATIARRLDRLDRLYNRGGECTTCWGTGSFIVCVPDTADEDMPEYQPATCPGCGRDATNVMRILGISDDEMP